MAKTSLFYNTTNVQNSNDKNHEDYESGYKEGYIMGTHGVFGECYTTMSDMLSKYYNLGFDQGYLDGYKDFHTNYNMCYISNTISN